MSLSGMMVHRCTIERNEQTVKTAYNVDGTPAWLAIAENVPCRLVPQISNVRGMGGIVGEGSPINLRDFVKRVHQFLFPRDTDISEAYRIVNVTDRKGTPIDVGPFNILLVRPATQKVKRSHIRLITEKVI